MKGRRCFPEWSPTRRKNARNLEAYYKQPGCASLVGRLAA